LRTWAKAFILTAAIVLGLLVLGAVAAGILWQVPRHAPPGQVSGIPSGPGFTYAVRAHSARRMDLTLPLFVAVLGIVVFIGLLLFLRMLFGDSSKRSRTLSYEEERLLQELHHGLLRLEERIEALETIMLGTGGHYRRSAGAHGEAGDGLRQ